MLSYMNYKVRYNTCINLYVLGFRSNGGFALMARRRITITGIQLAHTKRLSECRQIYLLALRQLEYKLQNLIPPKWYVELEPLSLLTNVCLTC